MSFQPAAAQRSAFSDKSLFSVLLNEVLQFCLGTYDEREDDHFQIEISDLDLFKIAESLPQYSGTCYAKGIILKWQAIDFDKDYQAMFADCPTRHHWKDLQEAFPNYNLDVEEIHLPSNHYVICFGLMYPGQNHPYQKIWCSCKKKNMHQCEARD